MAGNTDPQNPFDKAAEEAAKTTDESLAGEQAKVASLSWEQLKQMLPSPSDKKQLEELMKVVTAATDHNEKVASLTRNIGSLAGIIVKVLSRMP
jgi:hypothetical protein